MSQPGSRYRLLILLHSAMILRTLRLHSSAARSYPAHRSSLPRSVEVDAGAGEKGSTAKALLNFFCENLSQILSMLSCGGTFDFFFFLSSEAPPAAACGAQACSCRSAAELRILLCDRRSRRMRWGEGVEEESESESEDDILSKSFLLPIVEFLYRSQWMMNVGTGFIAW